MTDLPPMIGRQRSNAVTTRPRHIDLLPLIVMNKITGVSDLSGGGMNPIWLVTMTGTDIKLVVKAEKEIYPSELPWAKKNIQAMSDVMKQVSPTATNALLNRMELEALDNFGQRPLTLNKAISDAKAGTRHLTKMKFDPSFFSSSVKDVESHNPNTIMSSDDRGRASLLFSGLRDNRRAWQTLGQVIIADALIGNGDRISFEGSRVMNFGNLIFSRDGNGNITHAVGYDHFDPYAEQAKMMYGTGIDRDRGGMATGAYNTWIGGFGQYIKDKNKFPALARGIIAHINKDRMAPLKLQLFGLKEETYLTEGLIIGWDKLANSIGVKVRQGQGIPSGLMARAKYLGWVR